MLNCWAILLAIWEHTTYTLNDPEIFWEYMAYMEYTLSEERLTNGAVHAVPFKKTVHVKWLKREKFGKIQKFLFYHSCRHHAEFCYKVSHKVSENFFFKFLQNFLKMLAKYAQTFLNLFKMFPKTMLEFC